jgi:hypothetical protein
MTHFDGNGCNYENSPKPTDTLVGRFGILKRGIDEIGVRVRPEWCCTLYSKNSL